MFNFVPHQHNKHNWRTVIFVFLIMIFSGFSVYFLSSKSFASKDNPVMVQSEEKIEKQEVETAALEGEKVFSEPSSVQIFEPEAAMVESEIASLPLERNKDSKTKLEEAKKFAKPQILSGKYIDISLQYQNMVLFEDGKVLDAYLISSGKKGMDTPEGTFKIENKTPRAWSKKYSLWMPNWMAIMPSGLIGIHELPIWPKGYQEGASHLGTPVSHGCVRLGSGPAKRVFDWAEIGTPVIIHR